MKYIRDWDGLEWQSHAFKLVQLRHGAQNVQTVPDKVRGDAGIEYFAMDGSLYQSYAPEETANTSKAASAMKAKARRDLNKVDTYRDKIQDILGHLKIKRWILLCPFLDDKDVVSYVRQKGQELKAKDLSFLDEDFCALVQSQEDFQAEIGELRKRSLGPEVRLVIPTEQAVQDALSSDLADKMEKKLKRAFPNESIDKINEKKQSYVVAHLTRENALAALRLDHPELWERSEKCLSVEEKRLVMIGADGNAPIDQLRNSLMQIEKSLSSELSNLSGTLISEISLGTLSDWLMRCPLDFSEGSS